MLVLVPIILDYATRKSLPIIPKIMLACIICQALMYVLDSSGFSFQ